MAGGAIRSLVTKILFRSDETGLKKVETHTAAAKRQMRAASRAAWQLKRDLRGLAIGTKTLVAALVEENFGAVPIVDEEDRLLGIVSYIDLLRVLGRQIAAP